MYLRAELITVSTDWDLGEVHVPETSGELSRRDLNSSSAEEFGDELGVVVNDDVVLFFVVIIEEFPGRERSSWWRSRITAPGVRGEMGILWFPAMRNRRRVGLGPACEVHGVEAITEREREKARQKRVPVWVVLLSNAQVYINRHVRSVHSLPVYNCGRCLYVFVWVG